mmetsp:Transcript_36992/g.68275  ORF Transcript_36992/g.68275 Transcript_36992/m.68275 type:complete len:82 (+) Transcript_36992:224-469(+)
MQRMSNIVQTKECGICGKDIDPAQNFLVLGCGHQFHAFGGCDVAMPCNYMMQEGKCPLCRKEINRKADAFDALEVNWEAMS